MAFNILLGGGKSDVPQTVRDSNLELYRIIVMFLIVCHHYVVNSDLMSLMKEDPLSTNSIFYYLFGMWGKTGINCFVMITGYFMCTSQITLKKFLKLVFQIYFYNIIITVIFLVCGYGGNKQEMVYWALVPLRAFSVNFVCGFVGLFFLIPYLNIVIRHIDVKRHIKLCIFGILVYTVIQYIPSVSINVNYISWFVILYFIASFIRLYPEKIYKNYSSTVWGIFVLTSVLLAMLSVVTVLWFNCSFDSVLSPYRFVSDSNEIFALLVSITSFMFFKNLKIKNSRFINMVASTTFGILLIHANSDTMRQWLWKDMIDCIGHYNVVIYAPIVVVCIYVCCSFIDYLRIISFEKWVMQKIDKRA